MFKISIAVCQIITSDILTHKICRLLLRIILFFINKNIYNQTCHVMDLFEMQYSICLLIVLYIFTIIKHSQFAHILIPREIFLS